MKGYGEYMITEKFNMEVVAVGSDDGKSTYEIRRKWQDNGKKSLVISLYPTISIDSCNKLDMSTMHLLNHANELGWGEMTVVNLYGTVFNKKPTVSSLKEDSNNMAYIEDILERVDIKEYDIVIAWGNSLNTHKGTMNLKIDLLSMLLDKGIVENVKCITTKNISTVSDYGIHPLYMGLHYSSDKWELQEYPIKEVIKEFEKGLQPIEVVEKPKKGGKKNVSKNNE